MENKIRVVVAEEIEILAIKMTSFIATNDRVEKVHYVLNGEDAIQEIINLDADLVFTNMQMPKRTGLEVIEAILAYPCVKKKPKFVLVTANKDSSLVCKARELGLDIEYKPISSETIHEYINNL